MGEVISIKDNPEDNANRAILADVLRELGNDVQDDTVDLVEFVEIMAAMVGRFAEIEGANE